MSEIKAAELAYVRVQVPDLKASEAFFLAFGLHVRERTAERLYLRACGPEHHVVVVHLGARRLLATAFEVADAADLERASRLANASSVEPTGEPGGGHRVRLQDPDGNQVELVHGIRKTERLSYRGEQLNWAAERTRRVNAIVRPPSGPAHVLRLGHVVQRSPDVERMSGWYRDVLGLLESDDVLVPGAESPEVLMRFLRLDQGATPVDHHAFQVLKGGARQLHHIAFEVQNIDDLHTGHEALRAGGYEHLWGIGRHFQGSQIFDYWRDPFGVMYEHWTDTDMLDARARKEVLQVRDTHASWGPEMPNAFLEQSTD